MLVPVPEQTNIWRNCWWYELLPAGICRALSWDSSEGLHSVWSSANNAAVAFALVVSPGMTGAFLDSLSTDELHSSGCNGHGEGICSGITAPSLKTREWPWWEPGFVVARDSKVALLVSAGATHKQLPPVPPVCGFGGAQGLITPEG